MLKKGFAIRDYCTMNVMVVVEDAYKKLKNILDPELHIDIVSLGLIYEVIIKHDEIKVVMTLTTPGCPLAPVIDQMVREALSEFGRKVSVELVWDPPWTKDMMSEEAKLTLGML